MTPDVVVDVGNSRVKWGRVVDGRIADMASLALDDETSWTNQLAQWGMAREVRWAVAGVNPPVQSRFVAWLNHPVLQIQSYQQLPIRVAVREPQKVGIDRLLNAVAAKSNREPVVVVSVGTAVTIDLVDEAGTFHGGAILPGFRLMFQSLAQGTAKLPDLSLDEPPAAKPGASTAEAIRTGVYWSIVSCIQKLRTTYLTELKPQKQTGTPLTVVLTGGDAERVMNSIEPPVRFEPTLTLEGIRRVAEQMG
ncbi:MAG: type III pantothenate kinase [Gemmataceae bacterium]